MHDKGSAPIYKKSCCTDIFISFNKGAIFITISDSLSSAQVIVQISFLLDDRFYIDRNMALTSCISFLQVLDLNEKILNDRFVMCV